jgi:hypothetical protein
MNRTRLRRGNLTDTALVTALLTDSPDRTLNARVLEVLPLLQLSFDEEPSVRPTCPAGSRCVR